MIHQLFEELKPFVSLERIEKYTREIHRLEGNQSFKNYKASTDLFLELMKDSGFEQVTRYALPADGKTTYFDCTLPQAWNTTGRSFLRLDVPEIPEDQRIISDSNVCSFVPGVWCGPTPEEGVDCLILSQEEAAAHPERIAGNMVYMPAFDRSFYKFTGEQGGVGIIITYPPIAEEFPDHLRWNNGLSFCGWYHTAGEKRISVFSLPPRQAALVEKHLTKEGIPAHAEVRTSIQDGEVYTLTGIMPGKSREELTFVAHMYEPFLPDDAAGGVIICEFCRALKELVKEGKLPAFEKTLRIVLSFERYGFSEFYQDRERNARTLTVFSLDSACHFPGSDTSPETKMRLSSIIRPSFLDLLTPQLYRELLSHRRLVLEKGNLSDDTFCSDDWIGIPSLWFHSADKKYHHCTCYKFMEANWPLAEEIARFTGALAGFLTSGSREAFADISCLCMQLGRESLAEKICAVSNEVKTGVLTAWEGKEKIRFQAKIMAERLLSINRFAPDTVTAESVSVFSQQAEEAVRTLFADVRRPALSGEALEASQMVVKRLCPNTLMSLAKAPLNDRKMNIIPDTLYILMDGKRSVFDAVKLYEYEFDEDKYTEEKLRKLMDYLRYLEKYGYIEITAL